MSITAIIDIVCAVFMAIMFARGYTNRNLSKSNRLLNMCLMLMGLTLLADAGAYLMTGPSYPLALRYLLNLVSFSAVCVNALAFVYYTEALFEEKGRINPWFFRIMKLADYIWLICTVYEYIAGNLVTYGAEGIENVNMVFPGYIVFMSFAFTVVLAVIILINRKTVGKQLAWLLTAFCLVPIFNAFLYSFVGIDLSYSLSAVMLVLVAEFVQKRRVQEQMVENSKRDILADNAANFFALEDSFESLYDVELESGKYVSFVKGDFYQNTVMNKLVTPTDYFEDLRANIDAVIYEEDRDGLCRALSRESLSRELEQNGRFDYYYRLNTETGPVWFKMRAVWKDAEKKNIIIGVFNAENEMKAKEVEEHKRREEIARMTKGISAYIVNPETGEFRIISQNEHLEKNYPEGEDYTSSITRYIENDVFAPDREQAREILSLERMKKTLETQDEYTARFRDVGSGSTGTPRWYELRAVKLSDTEILYGFTDRDTEIINELILKRLEDDYFAMIYVNLDSELAEIVKDGPGNLGGKGVLLPYDELMKKLTEGNTDRAEFFEFLDKISTADALAQRLEDKDKAVFIYKSRLEDGSKWGAVDLMALARRDDGSASIAAIGFTLLDEEAGEKEELKLKLAEAKDAADAANKAKTDFLFNMSHDIRTPMNAIIGFTNMAKKDIDNPQKALDSLEKVQLSSDILLNLINDVLDMSRIESGKAELHEEKHDVEGVFGTIEAAMAGLAASKDIDLQFKVGKVRDRYVFADGARFDRVLINIISNAIKYTPGGGFVKVSAEQTADTKPGYGNYRFTVADSGIGMSEEFQKHMFEDFSREENSTTSGIQGTGLGLSLAKKLTDMMGGSISCKSQQGIGTTFTLVFPFRLQTEADMAEESAAREERAEIDLKGRKVLLVEDNDLNRDIAEDILTEEGMAVETAVDGQKAVNTVRERGADYFDFILMDIQMPIMNGYEATKAIRNMMPELKAPIIALSANAFEEDRKASIECGMNDHVAKPIDIAELISVLAKFL